MNNEKKQPILNCFIYCRVSTKKQSSDGESLDKQEMICRAYAERNGLNVVDVYSEAYTGRADHRPKLDQMIGYLYAHKGTINSIVVMSIDRLTRGGSESYNQISDQFRSLGVTVRDTTGIIQESINRMEQYGDLADNYKFAKKRPSKISETVIADSKQDQIDDTLVRLIGRQIDLTAQGYWIGTYPQGYISSKEYVGGDKKKTVLRPHPIESKWVQMIFKLRAEGILSDEQICEEVNALGYKSRSRRKMDLSGERVIGTLGGQKLNIKALQKIILHPLYAGYVVKKWTRYIPIKAMFDGLVSVEVFNKANRGKIFLRENTNGSFDLLHNITNRNQKRDRNNSLFPYKNVICCPECGRLVKGSSSRSKSGKHIPAYHCERGHKRFSVPKNIFDTMVESYVQSLKFNCDYYDALEILLMDAYRKNQKSELQKSLSIDEQVKELKIKKEALVDQFLQTSNTTIKQSIETKLEKIELDLSSIQTIRNECELVERDIHDFLAYARKIVEHPGIILLKHREITQEQALWTLVFNELPTYTEIASGTPKLSLIFQDNRTILDEENLIVRRKRIELLSPAWKAGILPLN